MEGDIIPNEEFLYRYIKPESLPNNQEEIPVSIFNDPSLSCDWAKYQQSPERSYHIKEGKTTIIRIKVCEEIKKPTNPKRIGQFVKDWEQEIIHSPQEIGEDLSHPDIANPSHSLINGRKKPAVVKIIAENAIKYKNVSQEEIATMEMKKELGNINSQRIRPSKKAIVFIFIGLLIILFALLFYINFIQQ